MWRSLVVYCGDADRAGDAEVEAFIEAIRRADDIEHVDRWVWRTAIRLVDGLPTDDGSPTDDGWPTDADGTDGPPIQLVEGRPVNLEFVDQLHL
ncbi:MAG: hypothetical protein OER95_16990, partial [Acidimicrobiia bacterium]|nr:hypothetical protein [Acidimicrobiia bacterium]